MTPPYTASLEELGASGSTKLMVNMVVNDLTISELPVRLHIKMQSNGITIESIKNPIVTPMFIGGGEAQVLMGDDLAQALRLENLTFKGRLSKETYLKTGQLPGGMWKISVRVEHVHTGRTISNTGSTIVWIASYPPPVLSSPQNEAEAPSDPSLPLTFSWLPSKCVGGTASLMYTFELWKMQIEGIPAQTIASTQIPICTRQTTGTSCTIYSAELPLEPGKKYCWRVTISDPAGQATIQQGGHSEVRTFQYLQKCPEICEVYVTQKDISATISWDIDTRHVGGYNVEMYDDAGTYHETLWTGETQYKNYFDYGTSWHIRAQGVCKGGLTSEYSPWTDFKIPERFTPPTDAKGNPYECGEFPEPRVITNHEEKTLAPGDTIENPRGTTKFVIYSATRNDDGSYRGLSYIQMNVWGVQILGEYDNLRVNTDGVIISREKWHSLRNNNLLLNPDPKAFKAWKDSLAINIASATYNNTIRDTITLTCSQGTVTFETIEREGSKYYAMTSEGQKKEITSFINGQNRVLVKDTEGHELVIDKDGNVMGVEEYHATGGNKLLLRENMKAKDAKVVSSSNVTFTKYGNAVFTGVADYFGMSFLI